MYLKNTCGVLFSNTLTMHWIKCCLYETMITSTFDRSASTVRQFLGPITLSRCTLRFLTKSNYWSEKSTFSPGQLAYDIYNGTSRSDSRTSAGDKVKKKNADSLLRLGNMKNEYDTILLLMTTNCTTDTHYPNRATNYCFVLKITDPEIANFTTSD